MSGAAGRGRRVGTRRIRILEPLCRPGHTIEFSAEIGDDGRAGGEYQVYSALRVRLRARRPVETADDKLCCRVTDQQQGLGVVKPLKATAYDGAASVLDVGFSHGVTRREFDAG